ncbi:dynein light chain roadblock-type 1 isoform X2 [Cavia porcellus]|uniref:dynein light chain roadblock-type 1 isoform X2 n=1 Tax=Cavia porcellus TaxID=10141 RepID=UPI000661CE65|nr:dynein light chain roadblock-type 1 isoform X3 [Cavia porcellus]
MAEVEETLKRLQSQKGVQGIIVVNTEGIPIKSTMDNPTTTQYANLMHNFILKARSTVREIDPQNDLTFLRIRSKKNEIMVAPGREYPCLCLNLWVARTLLPYSLALGKSSHCTSIKTIS